jgi:FG-GAP repeat
MLFSDPNCLFPLSISLKPTGFSAATITNVITLNASDSAKDYQFGRSAAVFDTSAVIGSPNANVDGSPLGTAYLFPSVSLLSPINSQVIPVTSILTFIRFLPFILQFSSTSFSQTKLDPGLPAPKPRPSNLSFSCGHSVSLSANYAVVGCPAFKKFVK